MLEGPSPKGQAARAVGDLVRSTPPLPPEVLQWAAVPVAGVTPPPPVPMEPGLCLHTRLGLGQILPSLARPTGHGRRRGRLIRRWGVQAKTVGESSIYFLHPSDGPPSAPLNHSGTTGSPTRDAAARRAHQEE